MQALPLHRAREGIRHVVPYRAASDRLAVGFPGAGRGCRPPELEAALEAAATNAPINGAPGLSDGKIHGEMGMAIGTGGMRSIYGSTLIPLGDSGALGLAFENTQFGRPRAR